MTSILAQQLRGIASLDADRITSHHGAPVGKSYLFTPKEASALDSNAIHNIASAGFDELVELDPGFEVYEDDLFSERSKAVDRMLLTQKENEELGEVLDRCLGRLSRWITLRSAGQCMEWLVRRFRVHELNVPAVIHCFLPYHSSPLFPRILSIILLQPSNPYYYLLKPLQRSPIPLSRELLLKYLSPQKDPSLAVLRDVLALLPRAVGHNVEHRALYNFYTATLVDFIEKERNEPSGLIEPVGRVLVEGFVNALSFESSGGADLGPAIYPPLLLLVRSLPLTLPAYLPLLHVLPVHRATSIQHRILTLLILLEHAPGEFDGDLGADWERFLASGTEVKKEARMKEVEDLVKGVWGGVGLRKGWTLLLVWFAKRPLEFASIIATMLAVPNLPVQLVTSVATELRKQADPSSDAVRMILDQIRQRYPSVSFAHFDLSAVSLNGNKRRSGELGSGASIAETTSSADKERWATAEPIVLAVSDDAQDRAHGCRRLLKRFSTGGDQATAAEEKEIIQGILLDRIQDREVEVLDALYAGTTGKRPLLRAITTEQFLIALRPIFYNYATPRDVLLRHIRLVSELECDTTLTEVVFQRALFPMLIATKSRKVTVMAIWDILASSNLVKGSAGLLKGLGHTLQRTEDASAQNGRISDVLARNIAGLPSSAGNFDFLISQAGDVSAPSQVRLLALLIISKALPLLESVVLLESGSRLLEVVGSGEAADVQQESDSNVADDLLERIFVKPTHEKTVAMLHSNVLTQLATLDFADAAGDALQQDHLALGPGSATIFASALYSIANSSAVSPAVGVNMLRGIFRQKKDHSLLFLAGIWTSAARFESSIRITALRHGKAFIFACMRSDGTLSKDFQLIIPTFLVCLMDPDVTIRRAALDVVAVMAKHAPTSQMEPFALNDVYGQSSQDAKLLEHAYVKKYLGDIVDSTTELALDPGALTQVHARALNVSHGEGKKHVAYRREVAFVLCTHIKAWRSIPARVALLSSLKETTGTKRLDLLSDLLAEITERVGGAGEWLEPVPAVDLELYAVALISNLDAGVAKQAARGDSTLLDRMLSLLGAPLGSNTGVKIIAAVLEKIRTTVFGDVSLDSQIKIVHRILTEAVAAQNETSKLLRSVLKQLPLSIDGLVQIIGSFSETLTRESTPAQKRIRVEETPSAHIQRTLASLMIFLESRDLAQMPDSAPLMSSCLNLLSETMQYQDNIASSLIDYIQQTLLVILTNIAKKIRDTAAVIAEALSVETVIRLIRGASNPRTCQQALLFIGSLAKLTPEAVLHNVMPIFTYIGSSDYQKDDMHSFSVVEKTVESIVPIMVNAARARIDSELDLLRDLQPLLRIFADMANRLPSHRTVPFFSHLIETLGPSDFLAAMAMLMSDPAAIRSSKTGSGPSSTMLQLPLALIRSQVTSVEIDAIDSILGEVRRLVAFGVDPSMERPFLESTAATTEQGRRRLLSARGLTLMSLCRQALPSKLSISSSATGLRIAEQLVQLSTSASSSEEDSFADPTRQLAGQMLDTVLGLLPVAQFLDLSMQVLQGSSEEGIDKILSILRTRIPLVQPAVRESLTERFSALLRIAMGLIADSERRHTTTALDVYSIIIKAQIPAEDGTLAQSVPVLIKIAKSADEVLLSARVLDILIVLPKRLLTRMIPFIKPILEMSLSDISSASPLTLTRTLKSIEMSAQLISSIPGFIPTDSLKTLLLAIFFLPIGTPEGPLNTFLGVVAKRIGTQSLFPLIFDIWRGHQDAARGGRGTLTTRGSKRFLILVQRSIRAASRAAFQPMIKTLFAFFLELFDLRSSARSAADVSGGKEHDADEIVEVEKIAIDAFMDMVEKLNEQAFKPLFARIYDWAFLDPTSSSSTNALANGNGRKVVVYHVLDGLIDKFKTIMTPYLGVVFDSTLTLLGDFMIAGGGKGVEEDAELWTAVVGLLGRSFEVDEGAFWTTETMERIIPVLGKQFPVSLRLSAARASTNPHLATLCQTLTSLATSTGSDTLLKSLNSTLLLVTRSEDAQVRVSALIALQGIWAKQEEMVQFVPETVAQFLSELLEDESAEVEVEARRLLSRIEGLVGDLSSYLE